MRVFCVCNGLPKTSKAFESRTFYGAENYDEAVEYAYSILEDFPKTYIECFNMSDGKLYLEYTEKDFSKYTSPNSEPKITVPEIHFKGAWEDGRDKD